MKYKIIIVFLLLIGILFFLNFKIPFVIFGHSPDFQIYQKQCDENSSCEKLYFDSIDLRPAGGFARLALSQYNIAKKDLKIDWLDENCECYDWNCKKGTSCDLSEKGSKCIEYFCKCGRKGFENMNYECEGYFIDVFY